MSETQATASVNMQSASLSKSDDPPHHLCVLSDDDPLPQPTQLKLCVSYDKAINSDLRGVLELLVQEINDFCELEITGIGYEKLHPLLLQLARFLQKDKEQMTLFLHSNHDFLRCLMSVADSTLKGVFSIS